jgi:hypothetical protein
LVSPTNLSLIQIQNFAIVFASTANPPGNTKYGQVFVHKAISYANDNILNALRMNFLLCRPRSVGNNICRILSHLKKFPRVFN